MMIVEMHYEDGRVTAWEVSYYNFHNGDDGCHIQYFLDGEDDVVGQKRNLDESVKRVDIFRGGVRASLTPVCDVQSGPGMGERTRTGRWRFQFHPG